MNGVTVSEKISANVVGCNDVCSRQQPTVQVQVANGEVTSPSVINKTDPSAPSTNKSKPELLIRKNASLSSNDSPSIIPIPNGGVKDSERIEKGESFMNVSSEKRILQPSVHNSKSQIADLLDGETDQGGEFETAVENILLNGIKMDRGMNSGNVPPVKEVSYLRLTRFSIVRCADGPLSSQQASVKR